MLRIGSSQPFVCGAKGGTFDAIGTRTTGQLSFVYFLCFRPYKDSSVQVMLAEQKIRGEGRSRNERCKRPVGSRRFSVP